jgi:hypothetical protein
MGTEPLDQLLCPMIMSIIRFHRDTYEILLRFFYNYTIFKIKGDNNSSDQIESNEHRTYSRPIFIVRFLFI